MEELVSLFDSYGSVDGYLSCVVAILYFGTVYALEKLGTGTLAKPWARGLLADYAYPVSFEIIPLIQESLKHLLRVSQISTLFWVGFVHIPGTLKRANISTLPISGAFYPTQPRNWLIDFWTLDIKWVFVAIPFGFLVMLLFYYDHVSFLLIYFSSNNLMLE